MSALTAIAWILAAPAIVLLIWFTLEVLLGLRRLPALQDSRGHPQRIAVVVPAHNEALGIMATLRPLCARNSDVRVLVVADNCSDNTAEVARTGGAEVIERCDAERRGKGFALAYGRDHLALQAPQVQPDVVVVLDADCNTTLASIRLLAQECVRRGSVTQARYLLTAPADMTSHSPLTQLSNFAMLVKNLVRARGLQRIGGGIPLFGTGMAFPWAIFAQAPLATDHLVEDMQLALDLAREGIAVNLVEDARVESAPAPDSAVAQQRGRWERGFIATALAQGVPMLVGGLATASRHRAALGLHLLVPPLALLLMLGTGVLGVAVAAGFVADDWRPAIAIASALGVAMMAAAAAWVAEGRTTLSPRAALAAPLYVLWKIPLYLGFLKKDRRGWTRTRRAGESD